MVLCQLKVTALASALAFDKAGDVVLALRVPVPPIAEYALVSSFLHDDNMSSTTLLNAKKEINIFFISKFLSSALPSVKQGCFELISCILNEVWVVGYIAVRNREQGAVRFNSTAVTYAAFPRPQVAVGGKQAVTN